MKAQLLLLGSLFSICQLISQDKNSSYFSGTPSDSIDLMEKLKIGKELYSAQQYDSVISLSEIIMSRSSEMNFIRGIGEAYFLKARSLNQLGRRDKAIKMYEKALKYFTEINDHSRIASAFNNYGLLLKGRGNFREAIEAGESAFRHVNLISYDKLKFHILNNLGNSYQRLALFRKATKSYFDALEMLKFEQDSLYRERMYAEVSINLGLVYFKQRLFPQTLKTFHEARTILEYQSMEPQLATVYYNLGFAYSEIKEYSDAEHYLNQAQKLYLNLNDELGQTLCKRTYGRISSDKNQFQVAINNQLAAVSKLEELKAYVYLPFSYLGLGDTYLAAEQPAQAELALLKGLQIALKSGQKIEELKIYEGLIELHKSQDELEMALMYYDIYSALSQELNDQQIGRYIGQLELKELLDKRDLALETLESEANFLHFQINRKNTLLILSIALIVVISAMFGLVLRQNQLKSLNKRISLEQKILRAQLNPHFIFNALAAIQQYIYTQASDQASQYLSKFSKLMRAVLENSRTGTNSLSTELETLRNYLDLQSLRFSGPFHYDINVDDHLDIDIIQVPSLIIQPLVENAVEHGLIPQNGGKIKIEIMQNNDCLNILVEDDGIGIRSTDIPSQSNSGLGTLITRERLALLNQKYRKSIRFKLTNRSSYDPTLTGTKAILVIPLI